VFVSAVTIKSWFQGGHDRKLYCCNGTVYCIIGHIKVTRTIIILWTINILPQTGDQRTENYGTIVVVIVFVCTKN